MRKLLATIQIIADSGHVVVGNANFTTECLTIEIIEKLKKKHCEILNEKYKISNPSSQAVILNIITLEG